jgi:hypothetical protein
MRYRDGAEKSVSFALSRYGVFLSYSIRAKPPTLNIIDKANEPVRVQRLWKAFSFGIRTCGKSV